MGEELQRVRAQLTAAGMGSIYEFFVFEDTLRQSFVSSWAVSVRACKSSLKWVYYTMVSFFLQRH